MRRSGLVLGVGLQILLGAAVGADEMDDLVALLGDVDPDVRARATADLIARGLPARVRLGTRYREHRGVENVLRQLDRAFWTEVLTDERLPDLCRRVAALHGEEGVEDLEQALVILVDDEQPQIATELIGDEPWSPVLGRVLAMDVLRQLEVARSGVDDPVAPTSVRVSSTRRLIGQIIRDPGTLSRMAGRIPALLGEIIGPIAEEALRLCPLESGVDQGLYEAAVALGREEALLEVFLANGAPTSGHRLRDLGGDRVLATRFALGDPAVARRCLPLLGDPDPFVRQRVCEGLTLGPRRPLPAAVLAIASDPDDAAREHALAAIIGQGTRQEQRRALEAVGEGPLADLLRWSAAGRGHGLLRFVEERAEWSRPVLLGAIAAIGRLLPPSLGRSWVDRPPRSLPDPRVVPWHEWFVRLAGPCGTSWVAALAESGSPALMATLIGADPDLAIERLDALYRWPELGTESWRALIERAVDRRGRASDRVLLEALAASPWDHLHPGPMVLAARERLDRRRARTIFELFLTHYGPDQRGTGRLPTRADDDPYVVFGRQVVEMLLDEEPAETRPAALHRLLGQVGRDEVRVLLLRRLAAEEVDRGRFLDVCFAWSRFPDRTGLQALEYLAGAASPDSRSRRRALLAIDRMHSIDRWGWPSDLSEQLTPAVETLIEASTEADVDDFLPFLMTSKGVDLAAGVDRILAWIATLDERIAVRVLWRVATAGDDERTCAAALEVLGRRTGIELAGDPSERARLEEWLNRSR